MCGIFGSPNLTASTRRMLPYLGLEMECRGRDAWGASNGTEVIKYTGPLSDTWADVSDEFDGWETGIFHTRGASCGSPKDVDNAHPFCYQKKDGTWIIGIHNGIISNHTELDAKYGRVCPVDSQHLWANRAEGKDWLDLHGWGNLAWYETHEGKQRMFLARFNNDALNVVRLKGGEWLFCSTKTPLINISKMLGNPIIFTMVLQEYYQYWFQLNSQNDLTLFRSDKELAFGKTVYVQPPYAARHNYTSGSAVTGGYRYNVTCMKCDHGLVLKNELLCQTCFSSLVYDYKTKQFTKTVVAQGGQTN